jgi:protein-tyrosine phosphatase
LWSLFKKKKKQRESVSPLELDIHSHLLPGIDDGSQNMNETLDLLYQFEALGYKKVITTPHIMQDYYANTPAIIRGKLAEVREAAAENGLRIKIDAAAEYYLDEFFYSLLDKPEELLTFGPNYILFETGFINQPTILFDAIFKMKSQGLQPIFAHPERYTYVQGNYALAAEVVERGALLQINMNSLTGYYSPVIKKTAEKLIDDGMVSFIGTDLHNQRHMEVLKSAISKKYFDKLLDKGILNNSLLDS